MRSASKIRNLSILWFVLGLVTCQCVVFVYYRDFRSFDLDGDGMRAIVSRLWWHKTENVTNSWYNYRYWLSESLLDLVVYWAYRIHAQLDWIRTLAYGVANLCSLACALILLKACGRRVSGIFMLLTWCVPVTWALSSYTQGMTTVNFWLGSLSGALLSAFLLTKRNVYLRILAVTVGLDLLHLYPSAVLINIAIGFVVGVTILLLPRGERKQGAWLACQALTIAISTYVIGALIFGFMLSADWFGYFKVLPYFVRFYFVTRAQETHMALPPGHIFDEFRWLLFGGEHILPSNEECEQPMYVPELALLPGMLMVLGIVLLCWQWLRTKTMPRQTLLLIPLALFLFALRNTATAQRHYMPLIFVTLIFLASTFSAAFTAHEDGVRAKAIKIGLWAVILVASLPVFIKQREVAGKPFGVLDHSVVFGRQAGFARLMGDMQTYIDTWNGPFLLLIGDNFQTHPSLLATNFIVALQPQERLLQTVVWADNDWQAAALARSGIAKVVALVHGDDVEKRRSTLTEAGYVVDHELVQYKKVAIFARRR